MRTNDLPEPFFRKDEKINVEGGRKAHIVEVMKKDDGYWYKLDDRAGVWTERQVKEFCLKDEVDLSTYMGEGGAVHPDWHKRFGEGGGI